MDEHAISEEAQDAENKIQTAAVLNLVVCIFALGVLVLFVAKELEGWSVAVGVSALLVQAGLCYGMYRKNLIAAFLGLGLLLTLSATPFATLNCGSVAPHQPQMMFYCAFLIVATAIGLWVRGIWCILRFRRWMERDRRLIAHDD